MKAALPALASLALLALLLACACAWARPAPWYWWRSKIDGARVCAQTMQGPGWERLPRAYQDSRCEKLVLVK
ncbi:hypothetical protein HSX11_10410 [Oxalobacteraceae bacterium]|nr:hypothetical protein [Oxalobacteraceae bacterium]